MKFKNKNHQALFTHESNKLNRHDNVKMAVLYLLTADVKLWNASKHHIRKGNIDLGSIKVKNTNLKAYTLLCIAKDIACGTTFLSFLVAGIPKEYGDLEGWVRFEEFMDELDEECTVKVHADAYLYGEGEEFIATPEEVAYMTIRRQDRPDFLEARCHECGESEFTIDWSPKELFNMQDLPRVHSTAVLRLSRVEATPTLPT